MIKPKNNFTFGEVCYANDTLAWETYSERGIHKFLVEKRVNDQWLIVQSTDGRGALMNTYRIRVLTEPGENQLRLKYIDKDGKNFYSGVASYFNDDQSVSYNEHRR